MSDVLIQPRDSKDGVAIFSINDTDGTFRLKASSNSLVAKVEVIDTLLSHLKDSVDMYLSSKLNPHQFAVLDYMFEHINQASDSLEVIKRSIEHAPEEANLDFLYEPEVKNEQP